ncbi:MAG: ABC transporter substrate-binding protein [Acidocella sp.]|nr:ABC transporter substrate-binding protein [Acidocella sp.]
MMKKNKVFLESIKNSAPKNSTPQAGVSRRGVLGAAGAGVAASALSRSAYGQTMAAAGPANTLKIGFVSPRSGPLAGFGEADPFVLGLARQKFASGLMIGGKTYTVEIIDRDTQSDPARASQLTKDLINNDNVDMVLATSTPEVTNPAADAAEAAGMPFLSTVCPWESWYFGRGAKPGQPSPFKWTYHFSFGVAQFATSYLASWDTVPTNKKIGVLSPNDADGQAIRAHLFPLLANAGYTIVDPGPYEDGTTDYADQIAQFKSAGVQIFNTFPIPPDFTTFWRQAAQHGLTRQIRIAEIAKTGLFPSQVEASGSLGYRLAAAAYWHKVFPYASPITGLDGMKLANAYETASGKQWQQQLGMSMALLDAGFAALSQSGDPKNKAGLAKTLSTLKVVTTCGLIDFTTGPVPNVAISPLLNGQWLKAHSGPYKLSYVLVDNAEDHNVPVTHKLLPYH